MTEEKFKKWLEAQTREDITQGSAIATVLFEEPDPVKKQKNILALKNHAAELNLSGEEFDTLMEVTLQEVDEGQENRLNERLEQAFAPFAPFAPPDINLLPVFPVKYLPEQIKPYVESISESIQAPVDMAAVAALTVAAVCVQGKFIINPKPGYIEPLNLYSVIIAPPSERKSPVLREMTDVLIQYQKEENERRAPAIQEYESHKRILNGKHENLVKSASNGRKNVSIENITEVQAELRELEKEAVRPLRLFADNVTQEALISLMVNNHGRMAIISSEGGIFEIMSGLYSGKTDIDIFTKAFSGDMVMIDRKGRASEMIEHASLTMLLMIQPIVLDSLTENKVFSGKGLTARFLYCMPKSLVGTRTYATPSIDSNAKTAYELLMRDLLSVPETGQARVLHLSANAHIESERIYNELEQRLVGDLEEIGGWAGKFHGMIMRLAGILHCCRWGSDSERYDISHDTLWSAYMIGNYFLEHTQAAFDVLGIAEDEETKKAKYILKRFTAKGYNGMSKKELFDLCRKKAGLETIELFDEALIVLIERGYFTFEDVNTGGRPKNLIYLNPLSAKGAKGAKVF